MSIFGAQVGNFIKKFDFDIVSFPKWNVFKNKSGKFKLSTQKGHVHIPWKTHNFT